MGDQRPEHEHRVTPLELYFDLVFVLAFTQVTTLMPDFSRTLSRGRSITAVVFAGLLPVAVGVPARSSRPHAGPARLAATERRCG